jgi:DNA topoisomerase I
VGDLTAGTEETAETPRAGANGGNKLVIVESPRKARTIAGFLGKGYTVESSIGHIRDMPDKAAEIPTKYRGEAWARLGVDVDHDFEPLYVVNSDKRQQVSKLKQLLKNADELLLATDEDREGEAIAWHLMEELKPRVPAKRMVFHEITPEAIAHAVASPRDVDQGLVEAYQTRRVLDRLYGYELSPVLWKKVMPQLSAGRVQSVAVRLVVDRERERIAFRLAEYWDLEAEFEKIAQDAHAADDVSSFRATLVTVDGRRIAQGRDFTSIGELPAAEDNGRSRLLHLGRGAAAALRDRLGTASFNVKSVERKPYRRSPYAPFRTTTLQQEASRKLGFSAKYTMQMAQRLYENGHITYMRTDSVTLSQTALNAARAQARQLYGAEYVPDAPRIYDSKVKSAQEAHEAIRPAGDEFKTPAHSGLSGDELRLYELVWKRTVASQMKDATGESVSVRVLGQADANEPILVGVSAPGAPANGTTDSVPGREAEFGASGKVISFHGFLKAYVEGSDDPDAELDDNQRRLPPLAEREPLAAKNLEPAEHATRPPARFTEATLIKELEDRAIGRPSTYASIIGTILDRGYVFKKGTALVPSFVAFAVVALLERHFAHLVDYEFTAKMEDALDDIANGEAERVPWLRRFYFGADGEEGLKEMVSDLSEIDARDVSSFPLAGTDIVVRVGRYGPYLERDGQRVNVPEGTAPDELTPEFAAELLDRPSGDKILGSDPETGRTIVAKAGRFGPYVTEVIDEDAPGAASSSSGSSSSAKPRTASLLKSMDLDSVTLDDALRLLTLPRTLGEIDGEPVTVQNGRYGPYVKRGSESRSLESEEQMFTVTMDEAKALLAQPKPRGRAARAAAAPPLRELGEDSASGKPIVLREGRFGPYVTDGETNASLRKGDTVESITPQRAVELLAERRAAAPAPKRKPGARGAKTAATKTAATKTAATRTATTRTASPRTRSAKTAAEPKGGGAAGSKTRTRATKKAVAEDGHDS